MCLIGDLFFAKRLFSSLGDDRDVRAVFLTSLKLNGTVAEGIQSMIFAHSDVLARIVDSATLADDDVTGDAMLTAEDFNA